MVTFSKSKLLLFCVYKIRIIATSKSKQYTDVIILRFSWVHVKCTMKMKMELHEIEKELCEMKWSCVK